MTMWAFGCSIGILFFAFLQLTTGGREPLHRCVAVCCFAVSYILMYLWAVPAGLVQRLPALANSDNAAALISAPAFYLASLTILHEGRRPVRSHLAYFIVPVLLSVGSTAYNALTAPAVLRAGGPLPDHHSNLLLMLLTLAADLSFTTSIVLCLLAAYRLHRARQVQDKTGFRHQVFFLFAYLAASIIIVVGSGLRDDRLYVFGCISTGLIILAFALSRTIVLYVARDRLASRLRVKRPEWDESAEELSARLGSLMEGEEPYRDETLTLRRLASMLGEDPKRLSYHFNVRLSKTFRSYLNELRLASVCRDLVANPRRSILETAFDNGFNSKASFNTLFLKRYGKTPREFRRESLDRFDQANT